jgi:hypothetical protein
MRVAPVLKGYHPVVYPTVPKKYDGSQPVDENLIITPRYEKYLLHNPDVLMDRIMFLRVMAELTHKPRDRSRSFSASSAGYCLRRQELAFTGQQQNQVADPRGIRIFNNGTFVHLRWQIGLLGAEIIDDIEYKVTSSKLRARANLDGLGKALGGRWDGADFVWEHKGRMSFVWSKQDRAGVPDEKTRKQTDMQLLLTGFDLAAVTNENKDTQEISEFVLERDESRISEARKELKALNRAVDRQVLHPMLAECVKQNKSGEFYKCPFGTPGGACVNSGSWPARTR